MMPVPVYVFFGRGNLRIRRPKPTPPHIFKRELTRQPQAGHCLLDGPPVDPSIDQSRQRHITGRAAETVEITNPHALTPYAQYGTVPRPDIVTDREKRAREEWGSPEAQRRRPEREDGRENVKPGIEAGVATGVEDRPTTRNQPARRPL
jgi:hypothetical protein